MHNLIQAWADVWGTHSTLPWWAQTWVMASTFLEAMTLICVPVTLHDYRREPTPRNAKLALGTLLAVLWTPFWPVVAALILGWLLVRHFGVVIRASTRGLFLLAAGPYRVFSFLRGMTRMARQAE